MLKEEFPQFTRSKIQQWIQNQKVFVNGQPRAKNYRLREGDVIFVEPEPLRPVLISPEPIPLTIAYEDEEIAVVHKPAGMLTHPTETTHSGTLVNALLSLFPSLPFDSEETVHRPGIVHRLDKDTEGLLLIAKSASAYSILREQFKKHQVRREYLALCWNKPPKEGVIEKPLGRHPRVRIRVSTKTRKPRTAKTWFTTLKYFPGFSLVLAQPLTGRTHQIRVHLQSIGCPILGDPLYSSRKMHRIQKKFPVALKRQLLQAYLLAFIHPTQQKVLSFSAPISSSIKAFIQFIAEFSSPKKQTEIDISQENEL